MDEYVNPVHKWTVVYGFPNYEITRSGVVRNKKTGRILKQYQNEAGNKHVSLYDGLGNQFNRGVKKLVRDSFDPPTHVHPWNGTTPSFDGQTWAIVAEFPEYQVSQFGMVRHRRSGRVLKHSFNQLGYAFVNLRGEDGVYRSRGVKRLVSLAFRPEHL